MFMPKKSAVERKKQQKRGPTLLLILDGFGLANEKQQGNAITPDTAPHIFEYMKTYPTARLTAHGKDVGLFPGQEGNSEAGHFNIGTGRVVEQDLVMITNAMKDGTFFKNMAFREALHHARKYKTAVHVMGLLTDGQSAHAHPDHLYALLKFFRKEKQKEVYLHLFTDGRDSSPHSAIAHLRNLRKFMKNGEKIASITGRFYAMDRNKIWERTEAAYNTMVCGEGLCEAGSAEEAIEQAYNRGETDEYICPTVIKEKGKPIATICDNDAIYFFNARSDRARQITKAFVQGREFNHNSHNRGAFKRKRIPKNTRFVAMTDFGPDLPGIFTAFPSPDMENALAKAIGESRRQLYISETEKYAHVTYFINGGYAEPINGEDRELIRSPKIRSYAKKPDMHAKKLTQKILSYMSRGTYDFICVNFPNADMVGHTGDFSAAQKAIRTLDDCVARLVAATLKKNGQVLITADHGNAEQMIDSKTKEMMTQHTTNPVPCIVIRKHAADIKMKKRGRLADVAPTVLKMLELPKPKEMTGKALF